MLTQVESERKLRLQRRKQRHCGKDRSRVSPRLDSCPFGQRDISVSGWRLNRSWRPALLSADVIIERLSSLGVALRLRVLEQITDGHHGATGDNALFFAHAFNHRKILDGLEGLAKILGLQGGDDLGGEFLGPGGFIRGKGFLNFARDFSVSEWSWRRYGAIATQSTQHGQHHRHGDSLQVQLVHRNLWQELVTRLIGHGVFGAGAGIMAIINSASIHSGVSDSRNVPIHPNRLTALAVTEPFL